MTNPEINDQIREEAEKFNRLHKEGRVSAEYLSVLPADQSPEETERIIENAETRIQDINTFGVLGHGSRNIDKEAFVSIITEGLKSKKTLHKEGKEILGSNMGFGLYYDGISFEMNGALGSSTKFEDNSAKMYGVTPASDWEGKEKYVGRTKREDKYVESTFLANPEYIRQKIEQRVKINKKTFLIVGTALANRDRPENFELDRTQQKLLEYAKSVGWVDAAKPKFTTDQQFFERFTYPNYDAYQGEVVIWDIDEDKNITEPMINGVVVRPEHTSQVITWMNEIAKKDHSKAVPLYNIYGDLIWPVNMQYEKVKEFIEKKDRSDDKP